MNDMTASQDCMITCMAAQGYSVQEPLPQKVYKPYLFAQSFEESVNA